VFVGETKSQSKNLVFVIVQDSYNYHYH